MLHIFHSQNVSYLSLLNRKVIGRFEHFSHLKTVHLLICLSSQTVNCRTFGYIKHLGLNEGLINILTHLTAKRIYFTNQMTLRASSDIGIAGHESNTVNTDCEDYGIETEACTGKCCLTACMTGTYNTDINFFPDSTTHHYLPIQNLEKISLTRSSSTSSPIIYPREVYAPIMSMV